MHGPELSNGDVVVSHNLTRCEHEHFSTACCLTICHDEPEHLRRKRASGIDPDHAGVQFWDIIWTFLGRHSDAPRLAIPRPEGGASTDRSILRPICAFCNVR